MAALRAKAGDGETYDEAALAKEEAGLAKASAKAAAAVEGLTNGLASFDFKYADPEKNFDRSRVVGTVASNFTMADAEGTHAVALEAVAGAKLKQVIVDNEKTAMLVLQKGKLQRRVAMVPLSKIEQDDDRRRQGGAGEGARRRVARLPRHRAHRVRAVGRQGDGLRLRQHDRVRRRQGGEEGAREHLDWVTPQTPPLTPPRSPHIPRSRCARSSACAP